MLLPIKCVLFLLLAVAVLSANTGCSPAKSHPKNEYTRRSPTMDNKDNKEVKTIPEHLRRWPGLYVREGDQIVEASAEDSLVAQSYPQWSNKGSIWDGKRLTVMTKKNTYKVNEEIHVIHVFEATEPGHQVYITGPKDVYGEYVNDQLTTKPVPEGENPLEPVSYNGRVLPSPAVDYNYKITSYSFSKPGNYHIYWKLDPLQSNILTIQIVE